MSRFNQLLSVSLLALLATGCGDAKPVSPAADPPPTLQSGGFLPRTGVADLRGSPSVAPEDPAIWIPQPVLPLAGWGPAGRGWHPVGDRSVLRFWRRAAGSSWLLLDVVQRGDNPPNGYQVSVSLNGHELGALSTEPGRARRDFALPMGLLSLVNEIDLRLDPAVPLTEGPPPLSLLRVGVVGGEGLANPPESSPGLLSTASGGVALDSSGIYLVPVDIPLEAERVEVTARNHAKTPASHRLFVLQHDGEQNELLSGQLWAGEWQTLGGSIESWRGARALLGWELDVAGARGQVELGAIRFVTSGERAKPERSPAVAAEATSRRPDVILFILDAARGDRFPGWDYPRQTMPVIDRLSVESLSFRYAFSECPTTSCSIPAIITGVPFLSGGEVGRGQQLADGARTLAEYLADLGYQTVGMSATPNNSASHNLDQGFRVFRELWGRGNPDHGPFRMSSLASEIIEKQPAAEPLFLQLHYLPPHQPYDPGPEFDRFTDPEYAGRIRPDMSLKPFSLGLESLDGADLEHLIGLYDGNLSVADAAVGQVLQALESAERLHNALIIITSDHGEAFMEHGRQGHNTTLFDEMLHVPLVVRLPEGEIPKSVHLDRLASVLDIVPTVLGVLGVPVAAEVGGLDLLHTSPDPLRPRVLFFRTSHPKNTMLAARTDAWKAISWPRHQVQLLFDLVADPAELENRVGEQPLVYAGLGLRIRNHLRSLSDFILQGEEVEMTEEAEEALRALGYLD